MSDEYRALYLETMERVPKLELGIMSSKSERLPSSDDQLSLAVLSVVLNERQQADLDAALEAAKGGRNGRSKPGHAEVADGRKPPPDFLPRVEIKILLRGGEEGSMPSEQIGEDVSETIERRPASFVVARVIRPKFVPKDHGGAVTKVLIAPPLDLPIARLAGPGMLAGRSSSGGRTTCR